LEPTKRIDGADAEVVSALYVELRRFAAVVAPWDIDPDDVLHTVLVRVLRRGSLSRLDDSAAYLRRCIVNDVRSRIRSVRARRLVQVRLVGGHDQVVSYPSDLDDLMRLEPRERAVLYLHDVEGFDFEEVATMTGLTAGNARVIASRARRRLRAVLSEEVGE
jgi:DNA-directed RNA polymerase specialized sigma24 family protein